MSILSPERRTNSSLNVNVECISPSSGRSHLSELHIHKTGLNSNNNQVHGDNKIIVAIWSTETKSKGKFMQI